MSKAGASYRVGEDVRELVCGRVEVVGLEGSAGGRYVDVGSRGCDEMSLVSGR